MKRFVLLDRDGTINEFVHHLRDPADMVLLPRTGAGLRRLRDAGFGLVVVTNQAAVGRGLLTLETLDVIHGRLHRLLADEGIVLDGLFACTHHPDAGCRCRKPEPGLVEQAARELVFDPRRSFVIGDNEPDVQLGRRVGATTLLVKTGYGASLVKEGRIRADYIVDDLAGAAERICALA